MFPGEVFYQYEFQDICLDHSDKAFSDKAFIFKVHGQAIFMWLNIKHFVCIKPVQ